MSRTVGWIATGLLCGTTLTGCNDAASTADNSSAPAIDPSPRSPAHSEPADALLVDVTESVGLASPAEAWPDGQFMTPEITPGGVALFDYDGDGRPDIYQICHCAAGSFTAAAPNRLFRQLANGAFQEVAGAAGLDDPGFGHGVAVGDVDNDGDLDVYVTNYGPNAFFLNQGDGSFVNATATAGVGGDHWSSSAGFLDYDRDGLLDLYVVNFATFDPRKRCAAASDPTFLDYCGPHEFDGLVDTLYHNNGDGTFTDVTESAGLSRPGRGWGLACADLTGDGWCDVYVANDEEPAQLWVNQRDGTFLDEAVLRGCAFNMAGRVEAGMGVAIGDLDDDAHFDLFKTHIGGETNTLYLSGGSAEMFSDRTNPARMGAVDRPYTGWGCGFFDLDLDGDLDMAVASGRVTRGPIHPGAELGTFWNQFAEPCLLFENNGAAQFVNLAAKAGSFAKRPLVGRGLAFHDLDDDGDLDLAVQCIDNSLRVYRNQAPPKSNHWLIVRCLTQGRDAYGAQVEVVAGQKRRVRLAHPTYSYLASNDPRAHFGLGTASRVERLTVTWPSGRREEFSVGEVDVVVTLAEGEGE